MPVNQANPSTDHDQLRKKVAAQTDRARSTEELHTTTSIECECTDSVPS